MLKKVRKNNSNGLLILVVVLFAAVLLLGVREQKLSRMEKLASYPNQACVGIGSALKNNFELMHYDFGAKSIVSSDIDGAIGQHKCSIGTVVEAQDENSASGYELGADVIYFKTADKAYEFAEKVVNPERYWGIDQEGQNAGIPQTSLFTFLVTDVVEPYVAAYTVRDYAVIRYELPCPTSDKSSVDEAYALCHQMAETTLKDYADTVQQNLSAQSIF